MSEPDSSRRTPRWRLFGASVLLVAGVLILLSVFLAAQDGDGDAAPPTTGPPSDCEKAAPVDLPDLEVSPDTPFDVSAPESLPASCERLSLRIFPDSEAEVIQTDARRWRASLPAGVYDYEFVAPPQVSLGRASIYVTDNQEAVLLHEGLRGMVAGLEVDASDQPRRLDRGDETEFVLDLTIPPIATSPQTDRIVSVTTCTRVRGAELDGPECSDRSITVGSGDRWQQSVTVVAGEADRISVTVEVEAVAQVGDIEVRTSAVSSLPGIDVSTTLWQRSSAGWNGAIGFLGGVMTLVGAVGGVRELRQRVTKQAQEAGSGRP
ncbi:hypothetical protein [Nocardioides dilutus]